MPRHSNADTGWIKRRFAKIEKQMREDRAAKKAQAMTVGKGGITVGPGGFLKARYPTALGGGEATRFGPIEASETSAVGYALQVKDEDGTAMFTAVRNTPTGADPDGTSGVISTADIISLNGKGGGGYILLTDGLGIALSHEDGVAMGGGSVGVRIDHSTTGASANCFIDPSDSRIWRSTSSRRYKQDFEDATVDPADVLNLQPRTWRDKGQVEADPDTENRYVGFIAEELDALPSMRQFVVYDEDGDPEAIAYDRLTVALLAVLKDHERRIQALEGNEH